MSDPAPAPNSISAPPQPAGYRGRTLFVVAMLCTLVAAAGGFFASNGLPHLHSEGAIAEHAIYQCPMHPAVIQDHPGTCPICGMKLVKVDKKTADDALAMSSASPSAPPPERAEESAEPARGLASISIDPAQQQLIGLTTEEARSAPMGGTLRTTGRVVVDETRVRRVNVKVSGFVERVFVDFVGKRVQKGDALFSLFSPELVAAEDEYLLALRTRTLLATTATGAGSDTESLTSAARRKLALWDVPQAELDRLEQTKQPKRTITVYSPVAGVVTKKEIVEGAKLDAGDMPYEIVDLSRIWVVADVYESELGQVREGMPATLTLNAFPNREFKGKAAFLDPLLDPETRTVKVRLSFDNPRGEIKPEMFGEVVLQGSPHDALSVPADCVIDSGTQHVVFVAEPNGKFAPRVVRLGESDGKRVEILAGLAERERVVTRANFLVDSESRLRASLADLTPVSHEKESARVLPATGAAPPTPTTTKGSAANGVAKSP